MTGTEWIVYIPILLGLAGLTSPPRRRNTRKTIEQKEKL